MALDSLRIGRDRLLRVFRFLEALNQHRNPAPRQIREQLWTLWVDQLPDHPAIELRRSSVESKSKEPTSGKESDSESFTLKVSRPKLTRPPDPGLELKTWLEAGWDDPFEYPSVRHSKNEPGREGQTILLKFDVEPNRVSSWNLWRAKHEEWASTAMKSWVD